jgi:WD40 repeat protein
MPPPACPAEEELLAFHRGELPDTDLVRVGGHLETCPACEAALSAFEWEADPVLRALRSTLVASTALAEAAGAPQGYEIEAELGRGGMGVVHLARDMRLNRRVALKRLRHEDPEERARFRAEAEAVARLSHPNIVQVYEVGEHAGRPFLALEYVDGGSLDRHLRGRPLPPSEAAAVLEPLARAVHFAHTRGIVHRDLKPANILLQGASGEGQGAGEADGSSLAHCQPKVTDFGIAKRLDPGASQTRTGAVIGTPAYMAPEQAEGKRTVGPAADTYALGVILYEMLTGRPPFAGDSAFETLRQVIEQDPVPPRRLLPRLPRDLQTVCLKCLAKDPARRYASAADLADDLRRFLDGRPVAARPVGAAERLWKAARRQPVVAGLAAAVVACATAGVGLVTWKWLEAVAARDEADHNAAAERTARGVAVRLAAAEREARAVADQKTSDERRARVAAELHQARLALGQGQLMCEQGDLARGLLWLARALDRAERAGDPDLARAVRLNLAGWSELLPRPGPLMAYHNPVRTGAFRPDGKTVVTGGENGQVHVLDAATGRPAGDPLPQGFNLRFVGEKPIVLHLVYSRDGRRMAAAQGNGLARLWPDADRPAAVFLHHPEPSVWAVAFSPDGTRLATACGDGLVRQWDAATGRPVGSPLRLGDRMAFAATYARDGDRLILLGGGRFSGVRVWDADTGEDLGRLTEDGVEVFDVVPAPGDRTVLVCGERAAWLWDVATRTRIGEPLPHPDRVATADFSPRDRTVVTACHDGVARLWEADTGRPLGVSFRHPGSLRTARFSTDGRRVLVGGMDGTARLWDVPPRRAVGPPMVHDQPIIAAAFGPGGTTVLTADTQRAVVWPAGDPPREFRHPGSGLRTAALSPDGSLLALSDWTDTVRLHRTADGSAAATVPHRHGGSKVVFSPDGRRLLLAPGSSAPGGGGVSLWDVAGDRPRRLDVLKPDVLVRAVAFRPPDGRHVLLGTDDRSAVLCDTDTGKAVGRPLGPHPDVVAAVAFRPDGAAAATGCRDGTIRLWDVATGSPLGPPFGHRAAVSALAFAPDGRTVLSASADGTARFWDAKTGLTVGPPLRHGDAVQAAGYGPDGRQVVTGSRDGAAQRWRAPAGGLLGSADRIALWLEGLTGLELDAAGAVQALGEATRQERADRLAAGGPPPQPAD